MDNLPNDLRANLPNANSRPVVQSVLNAEAKEFVPRFAMPSSVPQEPLYVTPQYTQPQPPNDFYSSESDEPSNLDSSVDDYIALNELKEFIDTIGSNPAKYEDMLGYITDVLINWSNEDPDMIMECAVNTIVDQAIVDANFRYNGVRLCLHFIKNLSIQTSKGTFKELLLQRCQREHARRVSLVSASDCGAYLRGLTFFMGDLCTKLPETELVQAVPDLLQSLVNNPNTENLKTCCQVLKLCGQFLDSYTSMKNLNIMNELFDALKHFAEESKQTNNVVILLKQVIELRRHNWTMPQQAPPTQINNAATVASVANTATAAAAVANHNVYLNNGSCQNQSYYESPSPNDQHGYDFGNCGDEANEDVCDAFEEFLRNSGQMN